MSAEPRAKHPARWLRTVFHAKLFDATVTRANPDHFLEGLTLDPALIEKVGFYAGEKVLVVRRATGETLELHIMPGRRGSGELAVNREAARALKVGERVDLYAFDLRQDVRRPRTAVLGRNNRVLELL